MIDGSNNCWSAEGLNARRHIVHLVLFMYLIDFSYSSGKFKSSTPHQDVRCDGRTLKGINVEIVAD
jgi:hypothetical protein